MNDPVNDLIVTLRPDEFTEDAYQRRRSADLARAFESARPQRGTLRRWFSIPRPRPLLLIAATTAAGLAAAAIIIPGSLSGDTRPGKSPSVAQPTGTTDGSHLAARKFLLAAAATTLKEPADEGRYWYSKSLGGRQMRWLEKTEDATLALSNEVENKVEKLEGKPEEIEALVADYRQKIQKLLMDGRLPFSVSALRLSEGWWAPDSNEISRSVQQPDKITFASPEDEVKWREMGSPELPWVLKKPLIDEQPNMSLAGTIGMEEWPTDKTELERFLRDKYNGEHEWTKTWPESFLYSKISFNEWVFYTSQWLLGGDLRSGTRAALYQILAEQPGITSMGKVTDSLGRTGVALTMTRFDTWAAPILKIGEQVEFRLIIDEKTAKLLAYEVRPEGQSTPIEWEIFENTGWVDKIGDIPQD